MPDGQNIDYQKDGFVISTDPARLDLEAISGFLSQTYWANKRPREVLERAIANSFCFGVYTADGKQVGFARVITDRATFGYLADVFILDPYRGRGLATWLLRTILQHPELHTLSRWSLATRDAHRLYRSLGFTDLLRPERYMEFIVPEQGSSETGLKALLHRTRKIIRRALDGPPDPRW